MNFAQAQRWYKLYDQAVEHMENAEWQMAIDRLHEAVKLHPESGGSVRGEGSKRMSYFPYYLIGKAHYHLGQHQQALNFFAIEMRGSLPNQLTNEIQRYRSEIKVIQERRRAMEEFNKMVNEADAVYREGDLAKSLQILERARGQNRLEFNRRKLGEVVTRIQAAERKQVEARKAQEAEQLRRANEEKTLSLISRAAEQEKAGALTEASALLDEADKIVAGHPEAGKLRAMIEERRRRYDALKRAALKSEREGRLEEALASLRESSKFDPERFAKENMAERASFVAGRIDTQNRRRAEAAAAAAAAETEAEEAAEVVSKPAPARRSTRPQTPVARSPRRTAREEPPLTRDERVTAVPGRAPAESDVKRAVLAAYRGEPQNAVELIERARAGRQTPNAELESSAGVAYARLSLLTADPEQRQQLREKASDHFRQARTLNPRHTLNSKMVSPEILALYANAR